MYIHRPSMVIWVGSTLAIVNHVAVDICVHVLFEHRFSMLWVCTQEWNWGFRIGPAL